MLLLMKYWDMSKMAQKNYGKTHYGKVILQCDRCNQKYKPLSQSYGYLDKMGFCIWCAGKV